MAHKKPKSYEALLLDLDGTLLDLDIEKFIPAYIDVLSGKFTSYLNRDDFIKHLFEATRVLVENKDPEKKNETVFYEEFCRRIGEKRQRIQQVVDDFYQMAGNDTLEDLNASEAGIDTFLVEDLLLHRINKEPSSTYRGSLRDLALFVKSLEAVKKS